MFLRTKNRMDKESFENAIEYECFFAHSHCWICNAVDSNRKFNIHLIQIDYLFYFYNGTWIIKLNTFIAPLAYAIIAHTSTDTHVHTHT